MDKRILFLSTENMSQTEVLVQALEDGWEPDPMFGSYNPVKLDTIAIYHLILYSEEEKEEMENKKIEEENKKIALKTIGKFDDVVDSLKVKLSTNEDKESNVAKMVEKGYIVHELFSSSATMIKRKPKDENEGVPGLGEMFNPRR